MKKNWLVLPKAPVEFIEQLTDVSPVVAQLLFNRGLITQEQIEIFLEPEIHSKIYDPLMFRNMEAALTLTIDHIKKGSKIVICGDYDADGVTSSAIMTEILRTLKANVDVWIPSRFGEGYGLNKKIISELQEGDVKLIITVDNGIRAKEEIAYAKTLGIDVIVTDHHSGPASLDDLPDCLIINPILKEESYPFKYLCGAGVAYKFASALIHSSTLPIESKQELISRIIDLAAIGTISDCVSLLGENRLIAKEGLEKINAKPRLGLVELMKVANLTPGEISEWNISWQITPRLNVAGRLGTATSAYELLISSSVEEARVLAEELNEKNSARQKITEEIVNAAAEQIIKSQMNEKLLVALSPDLRGEAGEWSEGVIGLVAGRLVERFSKPCFVISYSEGKVKGSGRSIEQYDLGASLEIGKEYLERYGGHKMACGFTVKSKEDLEPFINSVRQAANEKLELEDLSPILRLDVELTLNEVTENLLEQFEKFIPYGQDNPEPKFLSKNIMIEDSMIMGLDKRHIKFRLGGLWGVAFGKAEEYKEYQIGQHIDIAYTVGFNVFNNRRDVQLKIIDVRPSQFSN
ncbi:MAG TPA: single-stranded-DNA-specific exonuclease RecJ [bacterium]|nr:single-stranded-DNA-specific exonuclease RecJ [bacterium]